MRDRGHLGHLQGLEAGGALRGRRSRRSTGSGAPRVRSAGITVGVRNRRDSPARRRRHGRRRDPDLGAGDARRRDAPGQRGRRCGRQLDGLDGCGQLHGHGHPGARRQRHPPPVTVQAPATSASLAGLTPGTAYTGVGHREATRRHQRGRDLHGHDERRRGAESVHPDPRHPRPRERLGRVDRGGAGQRGQRDHRCRPGRHVGYRRRRRGVVKAGVTGLDRDRGRVDQRGRLHGHGRRQERQRHDDGDEARHRERRGAAERRASP